jgi:hypothetical protein
MQMMDTVRTCGSLKVQQQLKWSPAEAALGVLEQWLAVHGARSTKAPNVGDSRPPDDCLLLQLPFGQLQQLSSFTCCNAQLQKMQLGSDSTAALQQQHWHYMQGAVQKRPSHTAAAAHASSCSCSSSSADLQLASVPWVTKLTGLQLRRVTYCCHGRLAALSALIGLQQLQLTEFPEHDAEHQAADHQHQLGCLPLLTQLTAALGRGPASPGRSGCVQWAAAAAGARFRGEAPPVSLDVLQGLSPSVAKLQLDLDMQEPISISTVPALAQLPALKNLQLCVSIPADWQCCPRLYELDCVDGI